jgi:Gluconate 2-dehydrogenase subunit 3
MTFSQPQPQPQPEPLTPEIAGPQTEAAVTPAPTPSVAPPVLYPEQRQLLRAVLNQMVPARADLPAAGDLDVGASIERTLATSAALRRTVLEVLQNIRIWSERRTGAEFVALDRERQVRVLEEVEHRWPTEFVALVQHAYRGYYTLPVVQAALGFETRPPQPLGHELPPFDPDLLAQQRARAPFWRRTSSPAVSS